MKKVPLYVKRIEIFSNNAEELENLTDPNLYNTLIGNLELTLRGSVEISSKTIENLKTIYPNSITQNQAYSQFYRDESKIQALFGNFTKLLSNLEWISLVMGFDGDSFDFKLEFKDVILKVVESKEECLYIKAKSVEIRCEDNEFCWIK